MASQLLRYAPAGTGRDRESEIAILRKASEAAAEHSLDFDALMESLAGLVREILDYELYALLMPGADGRLRIAHAIGYDNALVRSLRIAVGQGVTGRAFASRQTVRVDDVHADPGYVRALDCVQSEVAVPLVARGQVVAVLDLQSGDAEAFDARVSDLLELVSSRYSLAIDNAQLYHAQAKQHATLRTLRQIAQEFSQILHLDDLLNEIATRVRKLMLFDVLAIYLKDPSRPVLRHYFGIKFEQRVRWRDIRFGEGLVGEAARSRAAVLVSDTSKDSRYIESAPGIRSEVAIPLLLKNDVVGVLDLESTSPAAFDEDDARTLTMLAPQVAAAIENAKLYEEKALSEARLERELAAARDLQQHMLPQGSVRASRLEIAARNEPAAVVSGDFYDFYRCNDAFGVLNGDVSGKGAAAALYAALASGLIRAAMKNGLAPGAALGGINNALVERKIKARFLAAFLAEWNPDRRRLTMASAGMPFPYVSIGGRVRKVPLEGVPLGLFSDTEYDEVALDLRPGDFAVSVSDGFSESVNSQGEPYDESRLPCILDARNVDSAEDILNCLFDDVRRFSEGRPLTDDRTAVVLRVTG